MTCYGQGGYSNWAATRLLLLWTATLQNAMLSHIHSQYIRVIRTFWSHTTTFFVLHSFTPITPKQPTPCRDISRMLFLAKHHQPSHLLNLACRKADIHKWLWGPMWLTALYCWWWHVRRKDGCLNHRAQPQPVGLVAGTVFFACSQSTALMEATERWGMVNLNAVCHFLHSFHSMSEHCESKTVSQICSVAPESNIAFFCRGTGVLSVWKNSIRSKM